MSQPYEGRAAISPKEYAAAMGVCIATVTNWIRDGRIKSHKIGARRLIPVSEIRVSELMEAGHG